ncbi:hypothetical protein Salat_0841500 [Sesamum alatum]|uniref:RNase H type-1 domain-containing protein n=1 Tax=Sesamum alatum TaxID=300844 RepID=A0AAE1YJR0_9LAMI|nr:hypothetical protein Salat_0841500 [Sesamum alatum]
MTAFRAHDQTELPHKMVWKWEKPCTGRIKLNFDGPVSKEKNSVEVGVVAWDSEGRCVAWEASFSNEGGSHINPILTDAHNIAISIQDFALKHVKRTGSKAAHALARYAKVSWPFSLVPFAVTAACRADISAEMLKYRIDDCHSTENKAPKDFLFRMQKFTSKESVQCIIPKWSWVH